ncbi:MAG: PIG-L deacetylase family protein [Bryobacteraceae bacterium]
MHFPSRRQLIRSGLAIALSQAAGKPSDGRLRIVVTGGHPGDPEYGCGGTVARYADLGHVVTLLYLNRGEKSCPESRPNRGSDVRVPEARRACEILKVRAAFADQCDGHAIVDRSHYDEFRALVAAEKPDVLFTHWPVDNHADHRAISMLAYDAWLKLGRTFAFYFYEVSDGEDTQMFSPTDYVDISPTEARKREACYAHASQNPDKFYALQSEVARFRGIESGYRQAEAFVRHARSAKGLLP